MSWYILNPLTYKSGFTFEFALTLLLLSLLLSIYCAHQCVTVSSEGFVEASSDPLHNQKAGKMLIVSSSAVGIQENRQEWLEM